MMIFKEIPDFTDDTFLVRAHHVPGFQSWVAHHREHGMVSRDEFEAGYRKVNAKRIASALDTKKHLFPNRRRDYARDLFGTSATSVDSHIASTYEIYHDFLTLPDDTPAAVVIGQDVICRQACTGKQHCAVVTASENRYLMNFITEAEQLAVPVETDTASFAATSLGGLKRVMEFYRTLLVIE